MSGENSALPSSRTRYLRTTAACFLSLSQLPLLLPKTLSPETRCIMVATGVDIFAVLINTSQLVQQLFKLSAKCSISQKLGDRRWSKKIAGNLQDTGDENSEMP